MRNLKATIFQGVLTIVIRVSKIVSSHDDFLVGCKCIKSVLVHRIDDVF